MGQRQGVDHRVLERGQAFPFQRGIHETDIEGRVVGDEDIVPEEIQNDGEGLFHRGLVGKHLVRDVVDAGGSRGHRHLRVDEHVKALLDHPVLDDDAAKFDDAVVAGAKAGRFGVEDAITAFRQGDGRGIQDNRLVQVENVKLAPIDDFQRIFLVFFPRGLGGREGLQNAMVRDGDRLHPHVFREFVVTGEIRDGIHRGHLGMQVEFHALLFQGWVVVARLGGGQAIHEMAADGFLFRVIVDVDGTTDADAGPDRDGRQHLFRHPFRV